MTSEIYAHRRYADASYTAQVPSSRMSYLLTGYLLPTAVTRLHRGHRNACAYSVTTHKYCVCGTNDGLGFSRLFAILPEMPKIFYLGGDPALSQPTPRYPEIAMRMNYGHYSFPKPWR